MAWLSLRRLFSKTSLLQGLDWQKDSEDTLKRKFDDLDLDGQGSILFDEFCDFAIKNRLVFAPDFIILIFDIFLYYFRITMKSHSSNAVSICI